MSLYKQYSTICSSINKLKTDWERQVNSDNYSIRLRENSKESIDETVRNQIVEINNKRKKLNAYLNIAKTHASKLEPSWENLPYDETKLARINVQISGFSKDGAASQLYTEVTGQLRGLDFLEAEIKRSADEKKRKIDTENKNNQTISAKHKEEFRGKLIQYLIGGEFQQFVLNVKKEREAFNFFRKDESFIQKKVFNVGELVCPIPLISGFENEILSRCGGLVDNKNMAIGIPFSLDFKGAVLFIDYNNDSEANVLNGIRAILLNIARYYPNDYAQVLFVDPIRFNNQGLGCLAELVGDRDSFIANVPTSNEEIRRSLQFIIDDINYNQQENELKKKRIFVFHNFPHSYSDSEVSQIRQLCANAEYYGATIILTNNPTLRGFGSSDVVSYVKTRASQIKINEQGKHEVYYKEIDRRVEFKWYVAPIKLPEDIRKYFITEKPKKNISNVYSEQFDIVTMPNYQKGKRTISNIPYGVDQEGNVLYLDFDNSNFATFICGAARSGKSTLLHTIITGILRNNHPDDIEIWLVDFKMTEFSRYTSNLPPHIRYVILDESPELVYDIVDRLTEILIKRQNIFKGKWEKLSDVPKEKYMPSLFVIIDEFSVMSQIIAESALSGKENYTLKLQTILAKGAALGIHFIFASQGFTSGTRGLNDFSKKQVQQRIAMKTEAAEIKATLDLHSPGDDDKARMEQLPVHHALVKSRVPVDRKGNYLTYSKVLFIPDSSEQHLLIDVIKENLYPVVKYDSVNLEGYIDKKSLIVDGNRYTNFEYFKKDIQQVVDIEKEEDELFLFVGEPRRMMKLYPIKLQNNFLENLIVVGNFDEKESLLSVTLSIAKSLGFNKQRLSIVADSKNNIYKTLTQISSQFRRETQITNIEEVCAKIKEVNERVQQRKIGAETIIFFGFESLYADILFMLPESNKSEKKRTIDINSLLDKLNAGKDMSEEEKALLEVSSKGISELSKEEKRVISNKNDIYDIKKDFENILEKGPKLGYHFIFVANSISDFKQSGISMDLFKHRILFRTAKMDLGYSFSSNESKIISELSGRCFRYNNGLESLSFRPYLHKGIEIDGWKVSEDGKVTTDEEVEDYLL